MVVLFDAQYFGMWPKKNAKMDKMASLTSRRLERENKCFTTVHDWRV